MAKTLSNYDPLVQVPASMTPANGTFPIVEAHDVLVGASDKRLDSKLSDIDDAISAITDGDSGGLNDKVDKSAMTTTVAAAASAVDTKIPTEKAVRTAIDAKTITVDSALSTTSTNAVQNKVVNTALDTKVDKVTGKQLSTEDYTSAEKTKLAGVATGATNTPIVATANKPADAASAVETNVLSSKATLTAIDSAIDAASEDFDAAAAALQTSYNTFTNEVDAKIGEPSDTADPAATAVWPRLKNAENDIGALSAQFLVANALTTTEMSDTSRFYIYKGKELHVVAAEADMTDTTGDIIYSLTTAGSTYAVGLYSYDSANSNYAALTAADVFNITIEGSATAGTIFYPSYWYYYDTNTWKMGSAMASVDVDPTLSVSGAAADAKVTGDQLTELSNDLTNNKDEIYDLNVFCKKEIETKISAACNLIAGKSVVASNQLITVNIANGQHYKFLLKDDDHFINGQYFLYENGTDAKALETNTLHLLTASKDINFISIYINGAIIIESGVVEAILYKIDEFENSLENQILSLKNNEEKINNDIKNNILSIENDIKLFYNGTSLILDNVLWENGQFDHAGNKNNGPNQRRTAYPIKFTDTIKISRAEGASISIYILELDENKSPIKDLYRITTSEKLLSNEDCAYIDIMLYSTTIPQAELEQNITIELIRSIDESSVLETEDRNSEIDELKNNTLGNAYFKINSKLESNAEITRQVGLSVSDFISIPPSFKYMKVYTGSDTTKRIICFYDENKEFLGWRGVDGTASEYRSLALNDTFSATYLRFTFVTNYDARVEVDNRNIYRKYSYLTNKEIPSYYQNYIEQKIIRINELASEVAAAGDIFVFITDEHWGLNQKNSIPLISYLNKRCHFNKIFSGGDTDDNPSEEFCNNLREAFPYSIYHAAGNHDWFAESGALIYYYFHSYNTNQIGNMEKNYYYIDDQTKNIRYIILNRFRQVDKTWINAYDDEDQLNWVQDKALNIQDGWSIIILTHWFDMRTNDSRNLRQIFDNARNNGKDIIAIFSGHAHYDAVWHTEGGIPIIVTTCDKNSPWIKNGTDMEPWLTEQRISGTINEQAFDVVIIDRKTKKITSVRIGAPAMNNIDITPLNENWSYDNVLEEREILY